MKWSQHTARSSHNFIGELVQEKLIESTPCVTDQRTSENMSKGALQEGDGTAPTTLWLSRANGTWRSGSPNREVARRRSALRRCGTMHSSKDECIVQLEDSEKEWWSDTVLRVATRLPFSTACHGIRWISGSWLSFFSMQNVKYDRVQQVWAHFLLLPLVNFHLFRSYKRKLTLTRSMSIKTGWAR